MKVKYEDFENIISDRLNEGGKTLLLIDGRAGSGKTTLALRLRDRFNAGIIHMDDFFVPPYLRDASHKDVNVHYERFIEEVVNPWNENKNEITYRRFDCGIMDYGDTIKVHREALTIVEGSYSHAPVFGDFGDLRLFTTCSYEEQLNRLEKRVKAPEKLTKFKDLWIPKEEVYFEKFAIISKADFLIET